jgi:hypothetical protein
MKKTFLQIIVLSLVVGVSAQAANLATWQSTSSASQVTVSDSIYSATTTGSLAGVNFTVTTQWDKTPSTSQYLAPVISQPYLNYTGLWIPNFNSGNFNPNITETTDYINYSSPSRLTFTFSSPVNDLAIYWFNLRGGATGANYHDYSTTPTFYSGNFTTGGDFSGGVAATIVGNRLNLGDDNNFTYYNGIIKFSGPISTLTVTPESGAGGGFQGYTLGSVPEPSALSLLAIGLGVVLRRRRRTV